MGSTLNTIKRQKRGEADESILAKFGNLTLGELVSLLDDENPQKRSAAAAIIGSKKAEVAVYALCKRLVTEKALYAKISICNALAEIGEPSVPALIELLGKIGKNQHKVAPKEGFYKKSYPLPRDIAARTLIRIGTPALNQLGALIETGSVDTVSEAIDAAGYISFYHKNTSLENSLVAAYYKFNDNQLLSWKILRSFQSFNSSTVYNILLSVLTTSNHTGLKCDALRSMVLNGSTLDKDLAASVLNSADVEVRKTAQYFLKS